MIILITLLFTFGVPFSDQSISILDLQQKDFPAIFQKHQNLVVMFNQSWCSLCMRFSPIYKQVVYQSKYKHPEIQFAKLDALSEGRVAKMYNISKYPTLRLFVNGYPIPYRGDRSKQDILKWIDKKLMPAVYLIKSQAELNRLTLKSYQSVVIFGSDAQFDQKFKMLALADDSNLFYNATNLNKTDHLEVKLYRNFDATITYNESDFSGLQNWIHINSRPYIQSFSRDLLRKIFTDLVPAVVFFNTNSDKYLHRNLSNFAKHETDLIFTEIDPSHELFTKFAHYLNIDVYYPQIIIILAKTKNKILYTGKITVKDMTSDSLTDFFEKYKNDTLKKMGITQYAGQDSYL